MELFSRISESSPIVRLVARGAARLPFLEEVSRRASSLASTPERRARLRRAAIIGGPALLAASALAAWLILRPTPEPDYLDDALDDVMGFTLLSEEFNKLPVQRRLELISQLVARIKDMDSSDSVMLAGFAAGIAGAARDQLEENAERLVIDVWDQYALDYAGVADPDREAFIDTTCIEFMKTLEMVAGEPREITDDERLSEARRQAVRDKEMLADADRRPDPGATGQLFKFMRQDVGRHASPQQRSRGQVLMRDMVRRLRGEDIRKR